ncbi:hypothetical protein K9U39_19255 [Rhodoblastus acidophilus]|uniref:Uncharacterized protein n=1 Tax=Candidatus Rhodoblastus alkanivorans TaxID=2954117 RepID=A0ABS9Z2V8_9HYPH|nr:hypothetical protein [Candidatus Rhodoblastus alkanivorans]MCI4679756.1 hypothetical protein [Candidatus Rhodoblastus alkanivorans]MCI4681994.1 hypothetical protein [Candidatus Rhodoblastus alkanivorans]MDI4643045.1 hypothetical protein [Rhodoblastus acidophilus]
MRNGVARARSPTYMSDVWTGRAIGEANPLGRPAQINELREALAMPDKEIQQLNEKLEKLTEALRKRTREFQETGSFSDLRRKFANDIEKKNDALRAKISKAAQNKDSWGFVKAELWRDYEAMMNEMSTINASVDSDALKKS